MRLSRALAACALASAACGDRVLPVTTSLVTRDCDGTVASAGATRVRARVYGEGLDSAEWTSDGELAEGKLSVGRVPVGRGRRLLVEFIGPPGETVVARGLSAPVDFTGDELEAAITVFMRPVAKAAHASDGADPTKCLALAKARAHHTATALEDGRVLVAGGDDAGATPSYESTTELFDAVKGKLAAGPSLGLARASHTATSIPGTRLAVLVGGRAGIAGTGSAALRSAEIFDEKRNTLQLVPLVDGRSGHAAAAPGGKLLVAGGFDKDGAPLASTEVFDASKKSFAAGPPLATARGDASALAISATRLVVAGGRGAAGAVNAIETFEWAQGFSAGATGALATARIAPVVALLADGSLLAAGGAAIGNEGKIEAIGTSERIDAATLAAELTQATLDPARRGACVVALPDASVLVVGGTVTAGGATTATADLQQFYVDEREGKKTLGVRRAGALREARSGAACTLLGDGAVLVSGGYSIESDGTRRALTSLEVFLPDYRASAADPFRR